ncbi:Bacteriophage replication gene A protein (GPA) [Andreprevotia lacus DSM 23236]|jgi:hypothetical protein|uniref:Bacteriophage replication gene A protein (GPA) n=1 Tax=Andreprevotia lacus DSM 23236 TaxID=1121001 RepID=A0A1W1Y079_9NEIS|nr:replication endonuclease [Andreprevotia lacus]SMC29525.1 Bacteriophage replication gene A protein (GPA) [Andreprevotia lacus DSM 23236]
MNAVAERRVRREAADLSKLLSGVPYSLKSSLGREWRKLRGDGQGNDALRAANTFVREFAAELRTSALPMAADDTDIAGIARRQAYRLSLMHKRGAGTHDVLAEAGRMGILLRPTNEEEAEFLVKRVGDETWWRGRLRRAVTAAVEHAHIRLGDVHRKRSAYLTDDTSKRIKKRREAARKALAAATATNEAGYSATLEEMSKRSVANPAIRRTELMVRVRGMEELAKEAGWPGLFLTLTAPSKYHAHSRKYNGASPRETQTYLCTVWQRMRARFKKAGLAPFGVRVAEPHHDGTPHWHLLLWVPEEQQDDLLRIMREGALAEDGDEPGAKRHRFTVKRIDPRKGSAVGYIAKYIAKNIDGADIGDGDHESGLSASEGALRVSEWASCWRIRQFQPIGQPPVTVWRELRKAPVAAGADCILLGDMHRAANVGDWAAFSSAYRSLQGVKIGFEGQDVADTVTGEMVEPRNRYGEPVFVRAAVVVRDAAGNVVERIQTRLHEWSVKWGRSDVAEPDQPRAFDFQRSAASTWTGVNNCNQLAEARALDTDIAATSAAWEIELQGAIRDVWGPGGIPAHLQGPKRPQGQPPEGGRHVKPRGRP